nr:MAG TPA: hypothetical protein [Bacteriophage sp.]
MGTLHSRRFFYLVILPPKDLLVGRKRLYQVPMR